jgi:ATP-dependent DNA helicase HFM1/MER3
MDDPYYTTQDVRQQGPARSQYNILQPQFMQPSRPVAPRERYRATQYDHPVYDAVEDDEYGQDAQLGSFGTYLAVFLEWNLN